MVEQKNDSADKIQERQWKTKVVGAFIGTRVENRIKGGPENESLPELCMRVINSFERRVTELLPAHRAALTAFMQGVRAEQFSNSQELASAITLGTTEFIVNNVSIGELEKGIRDHDVATRGWKPLNRVLCYEIEEDDRIRLRVPEVFIQKPMEFGGLFISGLSELAKVLKSDTALANITTVIGSSRLIYAFKQDMEKGGFAITINDEENKIATAEISAVKLIKR